MVPSDEEVRMTERSYVCGTSEQPLIGRTIGQELARIAADRPDGEAIVAIHQGARLTYADLLGRADRIGSALKDVGVTPGDRVGIWSANRWEWAAIQYATARIGAILVNVNPAYRSHELAFALRHAGISVLVSAPAFRLTDYRPILDEVLPQVPNVRHVVLLDPLGGAEGDAPAWAEPWAAFLERGDGRIPEDLGAALDPDDPINIQFTSGTTGNPKGATLTHRNVLNNGWFVGERLRLTEEDRICVPVPYYHCFGMVMGNLAALTHDATVVLPSAAFDPRATLRAVEAERCTALYGVPTMFVAELEDPEIDRADLTSLRTGIMAGSPCPIVVMQQVIERMHAREMTICYGMTETSPVSFQSLPDDDLSHRVETVGTVHPWVEAKVIDPATGRTVPRGETGELCTRGYLVMRGYWEDPRSTAEAVDAAGWMHTGDLAVMQDDGYVRIVGRSKDMIIRGGENVYPREIEEFLATHPAIADVQVVGVPDPKYGEEIGAWVILHAGAEATEEDIRAFCRGKIATYKIPRSVRFVDAFPTTVTGKVQKFRLREQAAQGSGAAFAREG
jgi:fatty-acyl-CoA synthase